MGTCAFCPRASVVRRFHGVLICEPCAREVTRVCSECGCADFHCPDQGPCVCECCEAVESDQSVDWEDGEIVDQGAEDAAARDRQRDIAAEERADFNAFQGD